MPQVTKRGTPLTEIELATALVLGHRQAFAGANPTPNRLACAWAHVAHENGRGRATWNNNFGNITCAASYTGDYYVIHVAERVQRVEDGAPQDVWKNLDLRFVSHETAADGARAYWLLMAGRYKSALARFDDGDVRGGSYELNRLKYYTALPGPYTISLEKLTSEAHRKVLPAVPPLPDSVGDMCIGPDCDSEAFSRHQDERIYRPADDGELFLALKLASDDAVDEARRAARQDQIAREEAEMFGDRDTERPPPPEGEPNA